MKTITIEIEDNYWLELLSLIKKFPIKVIEEQNTFDEIAWDKQIENDAQVGKLDALAAEALLEYHSGKATAL